MSSRRSKSTQFKYGQMGISHIPNKKETKRKNGALLLDKLKEDKLISFEEFLVSEKYKDIIEAKTRDTINETKEYTKKIKDLCEVMPRTFGKPEFTKVRRKIDKLFELSNKLEELVEETQKIKVLIYMDKVAKLTSNRKRK